MNRKDKIEKDLSNLSGINPSEVREYRNISAVEAVKRYLPENVQREIFARGYVKFPRNLQDFAINFDLPLVLLQYAEHFRLSYEGDRWYSCNLEILGPSVDDEVFAEIE